MFQPEISVKNGLVGKIRISRAEARSLVAKRSFFSTVVATAAETVAVTAAKFEAGPFANQRRFSQLSCT